MLTLLLLDAVDALVVVPAATVACCSDGATVSASEGVNGNARDVAGGCGSSGFTLKWVAQSRACYTRHHETR